MPFEHTQGKPTLRVNKRLSEIYLQSWAYLFLGHEAIWRATLPEISRFLGIIIVMYYNDHAPPHFHAKYGDFEAVVDIETGEVLEGRVPPRVLGLVQEWREYHRGELMEDWNLARERRALKRIDPLE